ncbi:hypothetical protein [Streptomyces sp. CT34]|nr:hypothetical protein [Streptomyces sp. CT34]
MDGQKRQVGEALIGAVVHEPPGDISCRVNEDRAEPSAAREGTHRVQRP